MKFFRTETVIKLHAGAILGLSEKQSKPRLQARQIRALKDKGKFEVINEVQFKAGEMIGIEGQIPKGFLAPEKSPPGFIPKLTVIEEEKKLK